MALRPIAVNHLWFLGPSGHARPRASIFSFTKTNRLPYDLCVRVALIILQHHLDHAFRVASDDTDWESARALCQEHLDYGREFTLKR